MTGDDGTIYFTGYIAVSPLPEYAGLGIEGPRYRTAIQAVSDELLLDQVLMPPSAGATGETAGALLTLARRAFRIDGAFHAGAFAEHAGGQLRSRAGRQLEQERGTGGRAWRGPRIAPQRRGHACPVQTTVHPLNETDGSLNLANLAFTASVKRALANDVTVCGEE